MATEYDVDGVYENGTYADGDEDEQGVTDAEVVKHLVQLGPGGLGSADAVAGVDLLQSADVESGTSTARIRPAWWRDLASAHISARSRPLWSVAASD